MRKTLKTFWKDLKREYLKSDLERYLEGSQNVVDLEHRIKQWQQKQHRANNVLGR